MPHVCDKNFATVTWLCNDVIAKCGRVFLIYIIGKDHFIFEARGRGLGSFFVLNFIWRPKALWVLCIMPVRNNHI